MNTEIVLHPITEDYEKAAEILRNGGLVAFPTETVYGLGGNALLAPAARKIYEAKGRPSDNPLIIHLSSAMEAEKYAFTCPLYYKLAMAFMPGPLTVILKKKQIIPDAVTGGLDTVAIRIPSDEGARKLLSFCDFPIAAPSANISGKPSPTCVQHVIDDLNGRIHMILGGEQCRIGVESTIVSISGEQMCLLRPGAITPEMLAPFCESLTIDPCLERSLGKDERPFAPGMKYKHYAPEAQVILLKGEEESIIRFLSGYSGDKTVGFLFEERILRNVKVEGAHSISLGESCGEQANRLFSALRAFDKIREVKTVYAPVPEKTGIGLAVYNRLAKAAGFTVKSV